MSIGTTYSPRKRVILQVIMWVLLVATVGMAALLVNLKNRLWRVDLADARAYGSIELRLPRGWRVHYQHRGDAELLQAIEPAAPRRSLSLQVIRTDSPTGPLEFLMNSGLVQMLGLQEEDVAQFEEIAVPEGDGIIIHPRRRSTSFAVLTFSDRSAVTVQMASRGPSTASDDAVLYHVVTSIRLRGTDAPQEGDQSSQDHEI